MVEPPTADDKTYDDEVAFWRGFITWWAREKAVPVPLRAWKALTLAQRRAEQQQRQQDEARGEAQ
jgi:hypothetical protein